ncbi:MAG TPA: PstS family phosphate ABC transporter substrate-binding protein [Planctomycetaceae bacterium]|nr:PstS family phosphate ABC transporter substrate-binding protein [Planctomycetaceae bacterium]
MNVNSRLRPSAALLAAIGLFVAAAGCGESGSGKSNAANGASALSGEIVIDGSSTVYPMTEGVANSFEQRYPNVKVRVGKSGTGGGFKTFTSGETDISDASRPITADEFELCKANNVAFIELPIAYDGLSIVVNPQNDWARQLTIEQLQRIYLEEHAAKSWNEVDDAWPDVPIAVYSPGTDSGTFDYFKEIVAPKDQASGKEPAIRGDMSTSEEDNDLVRGVAGNRGAIGYFGASYYFNNREQLRAVPIVDPGTGQAVAPTPETIESGEYAPFSRPLFIYVNAGGLKRPELKRFVDFYLDQAPEVARHVDYVALPEAIYEAARQHYTERFTGTHFLTPDGQKRSGPLAEVYTRENLVTIDD